MRGRGASALGLVLCLLAVAALVWTMPENETDRRTYAVVEGEEWFNWRDLQVRRIRTQVVTSVTVEYTDPAVAGPDSAFVVVDYQLRSLREPLAITYQLEIDGLRVDPVTRLSRLPSVPPQPGFTQTGTVVYQVPRKQLPGRALHVFQPPSRGLLSYSEFPAFPLELGEPTDTVADPAEETIEVSR